MSESRPYSNYKESGILWLPSIPSDWAVEKVKRLVTMTVGWTPPTGDDSSFEGSNLWANISDLGPRVLGDTAKRISDEAVVRSRISRSLKGSLMYSFKLSVGQVSFAGVDMYTNEAIATFSGSQSLSLAYAYYALPTYFIENASENIYGAKILNQERLLATRIALPAPAVQRQVASFLDRETAEIDAFIADQEELIALLAERRAATISNAVTTGISLAHGGIESETPWIESIPPHWIATRISRYFTVTLGKMLDAGKVRAEGTLILPYIRAANIQEWGLDLSSLNEMPFTPGEAIVLNIRRGDLLVVEGGAVGVNVFIDSDLDGISFQKTVNRVRPKSEMGVSRFLGFVLDHLRWTGVIDMVANKSTIAHLTAEKLERIVVAFPPRSEQEAIVDYLDRETAKLDAAIADAREAIVLSKERRAALISATVTGRIDVRGAA